MYIDPHVHCRDWKQSNKETIKHALSVAERAGLTAIFDMPNTDPALTTKELAVKRLKIAEDCNSPVFYGIYLGLTADKAQLKEAVETNNELFPKVVGFKLYAGHSVGSLGIIDEKDQELVYETLAELNYKGLLCVHCEKESLLKPELWNPSNPITHSDARPPQAEIEAVKDQIRFAVKTGFKGSLHITHISVPEAVELVDDAHDSLNINCGVTPHHILLDNRIMKTEKGILYKVNPPLRSKQSAEKLLGYLKTGKIDYLESDHAPHTLQEKLSPPYMSGLPNIPSMPLCVDILRKEGFSEQRIREITFNNIVKIFKLSLQPRHCTPKKDLFSEYAFNPYESVENA